MNDETVLAAERALIGSILVNPGYARDASKEVDHTDFLSPMHSAAWRIIHRRILEREPISDPLIAEEIAAEGFRGVDVLTLFDMKDAAQGGHLAYPHASMVRRASGVRGIEKFGIRVTQMAREGVPLEDLMRHAREEFEAVKRQTSSELETTSLGELLAETDEYDWVIPGLLEREDRLMLTGVEGGGKTTLGRQVCIMSAAGLNPMTAEPIEPVRVAVVDCENTARQWRRKVRSLASKAASEGSADPNREMHLAMPGRMDITSERNIGAVHRFLDRTKPDLLYIGPLYKLSMSAINSDDEAAPVLAALDSIRERGIALIIEAHAGHSTTGEGGQRNLRPRGSSQLLGWPELGFGLRVEKDDPSVSSLERWRGDRDERDWPDRLRRGGAWPWTPHTSLQAQVSAQDWTDASL